MDGRSPPARRRFLITAAPPGAPRAALTLLCAAALAGCVATEEVEVPAAVSPSYGGEGSGGEGPAGAEASHAAPPAVQAASSLGLEVEAHESDSLERLEVLPGARVASVAPGGPAGRAGLEPGDVILSLDGAAVGSREAFLALALQAPPGEPLKLTARRGTRVLEATLIPLAPAASSPPADLYHADPVRLRAGFRTVLVDMPAHRRGQMEIPAGRRGAAELVKVFPRSPLPGAGIEPGERITALSGKEVSSAEELVRLLLEEHGFGERVVLGCLRDGKEVERPVRLWAPRRMLTRLDLPPLFSYEAGLRPSRTRWTLLDLWILSLFEYEREEGEREYSFLRFIHFGTGRGELVEQEPSAPGGR